MNPGSNKPPYIYVPAGVVKIPANLALSMQSCSLCQFFVRHTVCVACIINALLILQGAAKADGSPNDVAQEFVLHFSVNDESSSFLFDKNMDKFIPGIKECKRKRLLEDEEFKESNLMHAINGAFENTGTLNTTPSDPKHSAETLIVRNC